MAFKHHFVLFCFDFIILASKYFLNFESLFIYSLMSVNLNLHLVIDAYLYSFIKLSMSMLVICAEAEVKIFIDKCILSVI